MAKKDKKKSGAASAEGAAEAWDAAAEKAAGANADQKKLPLPADEEQVRVDLELASPLSPTGLLFSAQRMAAAQQELERLDKELADLKTAQKEARAAATKERSQYAREVSTGSTWSLVPCIEVHQYRTNTVRVHRVDSRTDGLGEFIRERPMTGKEREKATFDDRESGEKVLLDDDAPAASDMH